MFKRIILSGECDLFAGDYLDNQDPYCERGRWKFSEEYGSYYSRKNIKPSYLPDFGVLKMSGKLEDFALDRTWSSAQRSFMISEKAMEIFQEFDIAPYVSQKVEFVHRKKHFDNFHYLFFYTNNTDMVDYENSIFQIRELIRDQIILQEDLRIRSEEEFFSLREGLGNEGTLKKIVPSKLQLTYTRDFFNFCHLGFDYYVSDRMREKLVQKKVKGVEFWEPRFELKMPQGVGRA